MKNTFLYIIAIFLFAAAACSKKNNDPGSSNPPENQAPFAITAASLAGAALDAGSQRYDISPSPAFIIRFSAPVARPTVAAALSISESGSSNSIPLSIGYSQGDSTITVSPAQPLNNISKYRFTLNNSISSVAKTNPASGTSQDFITKIDSSRKFPSLSDSALLDKIQQQTFKYFWDYGHPISGLARERYNSGETITSGGTGFGIMSILVAIKRNFITRPQGLTRLQTITGFLKTKAQKFHGAFPHWLNGTSGAVIPFSTKDNGADLVETSYLMQGLLCARQYFDGADPAESALRDDINSLWNGVEWDWFRQGAQNVLYWHWSDTYNWDMNLPIRGWNECLVTYVLAASSSTHGIPKSVYDNGWAGNGSIINGNIFYGYPLPLGPAGGGPLFFSHYSFLGINPTGLHDSYANYETQVKNHSLINYSYCKTNPKYFYGYSDSCWGLTASDIPNGYAASSPTNDIGVIAPSAAVSSLPYTPTESMKAIRFFYYALGDKLWKDYGFIDAFSLKDAWFAGSFLAIDQGPQIVMIENYRSGLLWNLFMSCPEVKAGLTSWGFSGPGLQ